MSIKFKCPHCKKPLSVKDQLAGKRAKCPACDKVLTIPALVSMPADIEALAAAALADEPAAAPAAPTRTIDFTCMYCDEPVKVGADLAGKQTPCPHCKHILKVPQPDKKDAPVDWRKADSRPLGARRDEVEPVGAWGSGSSARTVSREALEEAAAIPAVREPVTTKQWVLRGLLAAGVASLALGAFLLFTSWSTKRAMQKALDKALLAVASESDQEPKISAAADAEVHRAAGEYTLRLDKQDCVKEAQKHFWQARSLLDKAAPSPERDALLIDLALAQIELGGDEPDIRKGRRLPWAKTQEEVRQTLALIRSADPKHEASRDAHVEGLRVVSRKLIAKGQVPAAVTLAMQINPVPRKAEASSDPTEPPKDQPPKDQPPKDPLPKDQPPKDEPPMDPPSAGTLAATVDMPEAVAAVGWELLRAGKRAEAERLADLGLAFYVAPEDDPHALPPPPLSPTLIALCQALNSASETRRNLPRAGKAPEDAHNLLAGEAAAQAQTGNAAKARDLVRGIGLPRVRLLALINLAADALDSQPSDTTDLDAVLGLVEGELRGRKPPAWPLFRLAQAAAKAGVAEEKVQRLLAALRDPSDYLHARGLLEVLRAQLSTTEKKADDGLLDPLKGTPAEGLARAAFARHNARHDSGTVKQVDGWDEPLRPYGYIGVALGMQDR
jgi:hypothetical protein